MRQMRARVRPAAAGDLRDITGIYAHYVTSSTVTFDEDPPALPYWQQRLDDLAERGLPFLVAEDDGTIAGYACASPWRPKPAYRHTVEDSVYLAPACRGRGLGGALLEALLAGCATAGVHQVIAVIADTGDPASVALHRACGFTDAGRLARVGLKHGRWIDTILMQRGISRLGLYMGATWSRRLFSWACRACTARLSFAWFTSFARFVPRSLAVRIH